jgi:hypothetical protein
MPHTASNYRVLPSKISTEGGKREKKGKSEIEKATCSQEAQKAPPEIFTFHFDDLGDFTPNLYCIAFGLI